MIKKLRGSKMSMLDVLLGQIKGSMRYGNIVKNNDGSISMILNESDIKNMITSSISRTKTNIPIPLETLKSLMSVKIDKGKIEIKIKVM